MHYRIAFLVVGMIVTGCGMRQVRRSALVPAITPPLVDGQPIDNGRAKLSFGNATYVRASTPVELTQQSNAGMYIPRTQFGLQAMFRIGRDFALGPKLEIGLKEGAQPIADDIPPVPDSPVVGLGPAVQYSIRVAKGFRIGLELETLLTFAPYAEYSYDMAGNFLEKESGTDSVFILGMSLIPSYRRGPVTVFLGISGRNQPVNTKEEFQSVADDIFEDDNEVRFGPMYGVVFGGLNLRFFHRLDLTAQIYYPFTQDPVAYGGPALAAWLSVTLGDPPRPPRRYLPPPVYPAPAPAPAPAPEPAPEPEPGPEPVEDIQ
jgi:hypothetical protein